MSNVMMSMEELNQVAGGNMFGDAWNWICNQLDKMDRLDMTDRYLPLDWPVAECDGNC